jgi:putative membrane protein
MHTGNTYTFKEVLIWTRRDIYMLLIIATIPVVLYKVLGWTWLALPWLPIALLGTAVAFVVGFKNNASYDRMWEARRIWGAIVNGSRSWGIMVKGLCNQHAC